MIGKTRRSGSGGMRHRVTVQAPTESQDEALQITTTWSDTYTSEPAAYEEVTGGEFIRGRQVVANANAIFAVNYRGGYTTRSRLVFDGTNFDILRVHKPLGVKRFLELECKATGV